MSKREILKAFKKLHRICQETFLGDTRALTEARARINMEFKSNIIKEELPEKLKVANDVGEILKVQVVQAVKSSKSDNFGKFIQRKLLFSFQLFRFLI